MQLYDIKTRCDGIDESIHQNELEWYRGRIRLLLPFVSEVDYKATRGGRLFVAERGEFDYEEE